MHGLKVHGWGVHGWNGGLKLGFKKFGVKILAGQNTLTDISTSEIMHVLKVHGWNSGLKSPGLKWLAT